MIQTAETPEVDMFVAKPVTNNRNRTNNPTVAVVIPTLNEAKNLPFVIPRLPDMVTEVVIVDGRSTDNTVAVALSLRPDAKIVLEKTPGKGAALRAGFAACTSDIIVMLDADGSTDPTEIPSFVGALKAGADFVKGSRFLQGGGTDDMEFRRFMGNYGFTLITRLLFGGKYSDLCYGYSAFWRSVLPKLNLDANGFEIETQMNIRALRANLNIAEVASLEMERVYGVSNLNAFKDGLRVLRTITVEYIDHWKKRITNWRKPVSPMDEKPNTQEMFTETLHLLVREGTSLKSRQKDMTPESYKEAVETLKGATIYLMEMPLNNARDKLHQERLTRIGEQMWKFLEQD